LNSSRRISPSELSRVAPGGNALSLADDAVDLWLAFDTNFQAAEVQSKFVALLSAQECDRMHRLRFEVGRRQFALTRALQRHVLSAYAPEIAPAQWEFEATAEGRPFVASRFDHLGLNFNLSHTEGLVAMAVSRHEHVGVDVEMLGRAPLDVAERYFSAAEIAQLHALASDAQARHFVRLWTLKEAYLKAIGAGITGGLDRVSIVFDSPEDFRFECADEADSARWQFRQFEIGSEHMLGLALRPPADHARLVVTLREFGVD
jgi:4'-phosphopantetheinyl transferase